MIDKYPNPVVTFVVESEANLLLVLRGHEEMNSPGKWAFPGGKIEAKETIIEAIRREVGEETGLILSDEGAFLNSYTFRRTDGRYSLGLTFLVRALGRNVVLGDGLKDYKWIKSVQEIENLECVPGIANHGERGLSRLKAGPLESLEAMNLVSEKKIH